jgi:hypothetical protein
MVRCHSIVFRMAVAYSYICLPGNSFITFTPTRTLSCSLPNNQRQVRRRTASRPGSDRYFQEFIISNLFISRFFFEKLLITPCDRRAGERAGHSGRPGALDVAGSGARRQVHQHLFVVLYEPGIRGIPLEPLRADHSLLSVCSAGGRIRPGSSVRESYRPSHAHWSGGQCHCSQRRPPPFCPPPSRSGKIMNVHYKETIFHEHTCVFPLALSLFVFFLECLSGLRSLYCLIRYRTCAEGTPSDRRPL